MTALAKLACCILFFSFFWSGATAGVIQGVILENVSSRPLARTRIQLRPVPNSSPGAAPQTVRAGRSGTFMFPAVPPGSYILSAYRENYFPAAYGQRVASGQGKPIQVTDDSTLFAELRMRRMGAITGRVLDENGIGLSEVHVVAYRARLPLRIAKEGVSDDRGVYRIHGLEPGKYWVRSAAATLDDGSGLLPTFAPESREIRDARTYPVMVDAESQDADVRAMPGSLFHLGGVAQCPQLGMPVNVVLSSETGRRGASTTCGERFLFEGLAPATYEVYGETPGGLFSGFIELTLDRDNDNGSILMSKMPHVTIRVDGPRGTASRRSNVTLSGRRQDLSETASDREIKLPDTYLAPGHWEMTAHAGPGEYIESISNDFSYSRRSYRAERTDSWFETTIEARGEAYIRIVVSDKGASITGAVQAEGTPVPGIPVFLWPVAEQARRALHGPVQALSDVNGQYHFDSLPPGDYRLVASYDLSEVDLDSMEEARAITVHADANQTVTANLVPWVAPY